MRFKAILTFVILSLLGIAVIPRLSVDLNPKPKEPKYVLNFQVPGASPDLVERLATAPLENALSQIPGIVSISSISNYDRGSINLEFSKSVDQDFTRFLILSQLRQTYPHLDQKVSYPLLSQGGSSQRRRPTLIYTIDGPDAPFEILDKAEELIRKPISAFPELEEVLLRGANPLVIKLRYDERQMQAWRVTPEMITTALQQYSRSSYPGMTFLTDTRQIYVFLDQQIRGLEQIRRLPIHRKDAPSLLLSDVVDINLEEDEARSYFRINGKNAITLSLEVREGENKVVVSNKIKDFLKEQSRLLPEGYQLRLSYDDTEFVQKELDKIYYRSGLSILILTLFIFLINRNFTYLFVLLSGILINLALTSLLVYLLGIPLHLYSLAGLTISFGLIVDNAIVMMDHLHKKRNLKIFVALLAASMTTIAALLLVFFLPEQDRLNLSDFSLIVSVNLLVSLVVALWYSPAVYFSMQKGGALRHKKQKGLRLKVKLLGLYHRFIYFLGRHRKWAVVFLIWMFGLPVFMLPAKWQGQEWYNSTIGSDLYQDDIRPWVDKGLGGAFRLFYRGVYERSSYRENEKTKLYVSINLPFGNTLTQMDHLVKAVENYLEQVEGVDTYIAQVYSGQDASVEINFLPEYEMSALPYMLKARLISLSLDWSGARWSVYGVGRGFSTGSGDQIPSFRVEMKGYNYEELERLSEVLAEKLLAHKRIQEVNTNERLSYYEKKSQEYVLDFDLRKMAAADLNLNEVVVRLQQQATSQQAVMQLPLEEKLYPLYIQKSQAENYSRFQLENAAMSLDDNRAVTIGHISNLVLQPTLNSLHKKDREYIRVVSFEYFGSAKFGNEYLDEVLKEMKGIFPPGYGAKKQEWRWDSDKAKRQYSLLGLLLVAIFMICSILFENLRQPLFIILVVPISFIGLFLIFSLGDFYFDQGGYAAFILLGGLTVNAAIFILNDYNALHAQKHPKALAKAVLGKAQPILLTILSTCFGLIPFLVEGQNEVFWFSLAIGTIGGLLFSLIAVFVYLPVFLVKKLDVKR